MLECVLKDLNVENDINVNELIEKHMPFIIKSISDVTGRYVSCENDEELSVGMMGFHEAIERYDNEKGHFLSFAKRFSLPAFARSFFRTVSKSASSCG